MAFSVATEAEPLPLSLLFLFSLHLPQLLLPFVSLFLPLAHNQQTGA